MAGTKSVDLHPSNSIVSYRSIASAGSGVVAIMATVMTDPEQASGEATASLVAMADYMLGQNPQQIQKAVHCLLAALSLNPPSRVEARLQLRVGLTLYYHSNNLLEARQHLEQAVSNHTHTVLVTTVLWLLDWYRCF